MYLEELFGVSGMSPAITFAYQDPYLDCVDIYAKEVGDIELLNLKGFAARNNLGYGGGTPSFKWKAALVVGRNSRTSMMMDITPAMTRGMEAIWAPNVFTTKFNDPINIVGGHHKLHSSCLHCYGTKVKCLRNVPGMSCNRCLVQGITCAPRSEEAVVRSRNLLVCFKGYLHSATPLFQYTVNVASRAYGNPIYSVDVMHALGLHLDTMAPVTSSAGERVIKQFCDVYHEVDLIAGRVMVTGGIGCLGLFLPTDHYGVVDSRKQGQRSSFLTSDLGMPDPNMVYGCYNAALMNLGVVIHVDCMILNKIWEQRGARVMIMATATCKDHIKFIYGFKWL